MNLLKIAQRMFTNKYFPPIDWDNRYSDGAPERQLFTHHYQIADLIKMNSSVLEIGCGNGLFMEYLQKKPLLTICGIDSSKMACHQAAWERKLHVAQYNVEEWGIPQPLFFEISQKRWDYIIIIEVLEHLRDPGRILQEISKLTKSVILTVPNSGFLPWRLRYLFGRFPQQDGDHIRFWTVRDFPRFLEYYGFKDNIEILDVVGEYTLFTKLSPKLFGKHILCKLNFL